MSVQSRCRLGLDADGFVGKRLKRGDNFTKQTDDFLHKTFGGRRFQIQDLGFEPASIMEMPRPHSTNFLDH